MTTQRGSRPRVQGRKGGVVQNVRQFVGKTGTVELGGLEFEVIIKDYKRSWGRERFLIAPKSGEGMKWAENVHLSRA